MLFLNCRHFPAFKPFIFQKATAIRDNNNVL
jgi:hypothetical protein